MNTTGFGSWIAARSNPYVSAGVDGMTTLKPGDVREQRLEALRVLAARRAPGAELRPHGQRHLRGAAGHERQLRGLVEQLVETDAEEVEVHQLDDRVACPPSPRRRRGRRSRSRRSGVSRTRSPKRSCSPRVRPNTLPPAATSIPATNTRSSRGELHLERGADRVHGAEHRGIGGRSRRLGPFGRGADDEVGQRRGRGRGQPPRRRRRLRRARVRPTTAWIRARRR